MTFFWIFLLAAAALFSAVLGLTYFITTIQSFASLYSKNGTVTKISDSVVILRAIYTSILFLLAGTCTALALMFRDLL